MSTCNWLDLEPLEAWPTMPQNFPGIALTIIGWIIGGRVHHKKNVTKVTHPSTILTLGGLTSWSPSTLKDRN